jgi:hypothetical protein
MDRPSVRGDDPARENHRWREPEFRTSRTFADGQNHHGVDLHRIVAFRVSGHQKRAADGKPLHTRVEEALRRIEDMAFLRPGSPERRRAGRHLAEIHLDSEMRNRFSGQGVQHPAIDAARARCRDQAFVLGEIDLVGCRGDSVPAHQQTQLPMVGGVGDREVPVGIARVIGRDQVTDGFVRVDLDDGLRDGMPSVVHHAAVQFASGRQLNVHAPFGLIASKPCVSHERGVSLVRDPENVVSAVYETQLVHAVRVRAGLFAFPRQA